MVLSWSLILASIERLQGSDYNVLRTYFFSCKFNCTIVKYETIVFDKVVLDLKQL